MMLGNNNDAYYAARAAKERANADKAIDPAIRKIHMEMAMRYDSLAAGQNLPTFRKQMSR